MTHLVIGLGEVGSALQEVLGCPGIDKGDEIPEAECIHICIPYSKHFEKIVRRYQHDTKCFTTIIHSTVPIGTSERLYAYHSPIRGVHPNLAEGIRTFVKFLGPHNPKLAEEFEKRGVTVFQCNSSRDCEAMKLWDTTQYGLLILLQKYIHWWCKRHEVDPFAVYTHANRTYNDGYQSLERPEVVRPHYKQMDGQIGGHCVIPNAKILNTPITKLLLFVNKLL